MPLPRLLFACLFLLWADPAWAALAIDGTNQAVGLPSTVLTLTTTSFPDVIIVSGKSNNTNGPCSRVNTIDGGGLTWIRRASDDYASDGCSSEWYAIANTALTRATITVTSNGSASRFVAYGISGANTVSPFDSNPSFPVTVVAGAANPIATYSTSNENDILIGNSACDGAASTTQPSGWTNTVVSGFPSSNWSYNIVPSIQTGATATWTIASPVKGCGVIVDAVTSATSRSGALPGGTTGQLQYKAGTSTFGGLRSFYVMGYGALCDGTTDDTAAINAAITAANANGGGDVHFPGGTCIYGGNLPIYSYISYSGEGLGTTLKLKAGANTDVMVTSGFNALVGTGGSGGPHAFTIRNMTIDGNSGSNTTSHNTPTTCGATSATANGIKIYGYDYTLENIQLIHLAGCGIYTEWGTAGDISPDEMETTIHNIKIGFNGGAAMIYKGPHDSKLGLIYTFWNAQGGTYVYGGGTSGANGSPLAIIGYHGYQNPGNNASDITRALAGQFDMVTSNTAFECISCDFEGGINIIGGEGAPLNTILIDNQIGALVLGTNGASVDAPYKTKITNSGVDWLVNYSSSGFQDTWIGNALNSTSTASGTVSYTPTRAVANVGMADH